MSGESLYRHVLITGAAGYLGAVLRKALRKDGLALRLSDRDKPSDLLPSEDFLAADLASARDVARLMDGIEAVVHLGAYSVEGSWDEILQSNIVGTYNVFEAARKAGVKRIVFASTHHVVGYYRRDRTIDTHVPLRPDSRYAVSKVFGEALGRLYADKHGISVICQRIGVARPQPIHRRALRTWLSEDDFVQLTRRCLSVPDVHFHIVYGVSANTGAFWDNAKAAAALGFEAASNGTDFTTEIEALPDNDNAIARLFQGGQFCGMEFDGDPDRIT